MGELERRQQETQRGAQRDAVESEKQALFNSPSDAVVGNQKGNATLVVFFDYNCPYCKKAASDLDELMKSDPNLRVVLKEFPVVRPPDSLEAARIALAARQQLKDDKYFDFHMRLMTAKGLVNKERALEVAKEMKLDMAKLTKDSGSGGDSRCHPEHCATRRQARHHRHAEFRGRRHGHFRGRWK